MLQTVVAQMIAKGTFGQQLLRIDGACDDEVGVHSNGDAYWANGPCTRRPPRAPAKASSGRDSGNGITAAKVIAGGPPTKMLTRNGTPRLRAAAWWTPMPRWIW